MILYLFSLNNTSAHVRRVDKKKKKNIFEENEKEKKKNDTDIFVHHIVFIFDFRSALIGCMSFNMKTLLKTTSCTKVRKSIKTMCENEVWSEIFI